jgi:hypothetical protein
MSGVEIAMIAATTAQVGSSVVKGVSSYQNSRLQAKLAQRDGDQALQRGQIEQDIALTEGERIIGEGKALAGSSGFDLSGSPSDIFARLGAERSAAARTSMYEGQTARENAYIEAKQIKKAGDMEALSAGLEAVSTAVSGGMSAYQAGAPRRHAASTTKWTETQRSRIPANLPPYQPLSLTSRIAPGGGRIKLQGSTRRVYGPNYVG